MIGFKNVLTTGLEMILNSNNKNSDIYIYSEPMGNRYLIRYTGATIGNIEINEFNEIVNVTLYEDILNIFIEDVNYEKFIKYFIGKRLAIPKKGDMY
ncbi:MAG: hypothetical protein ACRDD7_17075 [Peptostreptococcaceae bacterium]